MKDKYIEAFLEAVKSILEQFGISDIAKGDIIEKPEMIIEKDVTTFIGVVGELKGNISYSFNLETAKNIAATMMMGMEISEVDEMARSAIAEIANMITGNAITLIANDKISADITTPSVVVGTEVYFILSFIKTLSMNITTSIGEIEVNIGLEM